MACLAVPFARVDERVAALKGGWSARVCRASGASLRRPVRCLCWLCVCLFFFSSRRRHTRFKCDWSSDVCSSDLTTLSRRPYGRGGGGDRVLRMSVVKAETDAGAAPGRPADGRSPFVRLAELLADVKPGKNPINLAVGEPQHPIPAFVGPVIAAHLTEFGRYPAGKGTERVRRGAARWLSR